MKMLCALGGHEAGDETVYNSGYYFSCCRRCGTDMVRAGASWRAVAEGHKVVWKAGRHAHSVGADHGSVLPVALPGKKAPATRSLVRRGRRNLPVPAQQTRRTNTAAIPSGERRDYPYLLACAALIGAGLQLALGLRDFRGGF